MIRIHYQITTTYESAYLEQDSAFSFHQVWKAHVEDPAKYFAEV